MKNIIRMLSPIIYISSVSTFDFKLTDVESLIVAAIEILMIFCLFGFNAAFKHLRLYHDGACL